MPNVKNINLLIETIAAVSPQLLLMTGYSQPVDGCGTAHCVGGWVRVAASQRSYMGDGHRAAWLGVTEDELRDVEYMPGYGLAWFDRFPPKQRQAAVIAMLETLRDTGEVDWHGSLKKANIHE